MDLRSSDPPFPAPAQLIILAQVRPSAKDAMQGCNSGQKFNSSEGEIDLFLIQESEHRRPATGGRCAAM